MLIQKLLSVAEVTGQAVLYILLLLSVVSIAVIAERQLFFFKRRGDASKLARDLIKLLKQRDHDGAMKLLAGSKMIEAQAVAQAMASYDDGADAFEEALAASLKEFRPQVEGGLTFLGTLGNNAPFIGLFGTVLGIVTAFRELGNASANGMGNVMGGIAEALVATAVGILVALPAVIAYNIYSKKAVAFEDQTLAIGNHVLALLKRNTTSVKESARPRATPALTVEKAS